MLEKKELMKLFPTLKDTPQVPTPFRCKLWHKWKTWTSRLRSTSDAVRVCLRCGRVEHGWTAIGGTAGYYERFELAGYIHPNTAQMTKLGERR